MVVRARSLLAWLARHAQHIRSLSCAFAAIGDLAAITELAGILMSSLAMCGAAGQLKELCLGRGILPPASSWLPLMRSLRSLTVTRVGGQLAVPNIVMLTLLERLQLSDSRVDFPASSQQPPSLTQLLISDGQTSELPAQVRPSKRLYCCSVLLEWPLPFRSWFSWFKPLGLFTLCLSAGHHTHQAAAAGAGERAVQQHQHEGSFPTVQPDTSGACRDKACAHQPVLHDLAAPPHGSMPPSCPRSDGRRAWRSPATAASSDLPADQGLWSKLCLH